MWDECERFCFLQAQKEIFGVPYVSLQVTSQFTVVADPVY